MNKADKETIRAAMSLLGKRKSKAKTLAARRNAKKGGRPKGKRRKKRTVLERL